MPNLKDKDITVLISGHFNVVHAGHIRMFRLARELGSRVVVVVESDTLAGPDAYVTEDLRLEGVKSILYVDEAFIEHGSINSAILRIQPEIVLKGKEHEERFNREADVVKSYGGQLRFCSGHTLFSRNELNNHFSNPIKNGIVLPDRYLKRHNIQKKDLVGRVELNKTLKIIVIGDLIVDEYIDCQPIGMSQEDATLVVSPVGSKRYVGGAGIVAAHAAGLGAKIDFITIVGDDDARDYLQAQLTDYGVSHHMIVDDARPTTVKQRFRAKGKTLLRLNSYRESSISKSLQDKVLADIENKLNGSSVLVFSDFNYGVLPTELVEKIILKCRELGVYTIADSQSSSQLGDISRFRGVDLVTPTEYELRIAMKDRESGLIALMESFCRQTQVKNVFLKLGEDGMIVYSVDPRFGNFLTDEIPALNNLALDVAGAGDSLLIASALSLASGATIWEAAIIGSLAAAVQVGRVGNIPLRSEELFRMFID